MYNLLYCIFSLYLSPDVKTGRIRHKLSMLNSVLMALSLRGVEIHLMIFLGTDYTDFTEKRIKKICAFHVIRA